MASYYSLQSSLVAANPVHHVTSSFIPQRCKHARQTTEETPTDNLPGTSQSEKRVSICEKESTEKSRETGLNKACRQPVNSCLSATGNYCPNGCRAHRETHPRVSETRPFKRPKQIGPDAPNPGSQTVQKRARSILAPRPSTAFQPLRTKPAANLRHRCDLPCSRHIMKTPVPDDSRSTAPNREVSPAVPTSMRKGQKVLKMSISLPTHAS
jgi:hypothetical protein